jgi:hypothetical protein
LLQGSSFCKDLSRFDEYHDPKGDDNLPRRKYTAQSTRFTQNGMVNERTAARARRIVHAPVIIMLVSRKRLVVQTSGGVLRWAMMIVHGRLIRIDARDNPDNEPKRQVT